jgi:hypothetical protein
LNRRIGAGDRRVCIWDRWRYNQKGCIKSNFDNALTFDTAIIFLITATNMITSVEIYLGDLDPNPEDKWIGAFAIISNIGKRLKKLEEISYRKWRLTLADGQSDQSHIFWDDGKNLEALLFIDFQKIISCAEFQSIQLLYEMIFEALGQIWQVKSWNPDRLAEMHAAIKEENYKVSIIYGKDFPSPDKKRKAQFYCELFTDFAEYYVRFIGKGNKVHENIHFLKVDVDPDSYFMYFTNHYWNDKENFIVSDFNNEIFYIFNVNSGCFSIEYRPIDNSLEQLQNYVKAMQYGIPREERLRLLAKKI